MLVVNRFRVAEPGSRDAADFRAAIETAHRTLADQRGYLGGAVGCNVDDPTLWVLQTRWVNVGAYRRALSSYDAKLHAWPVLINALDEPSAYEVVEPGTDPNIWSARSVG